jgi:fluoroacetyl-CoA thioesterase
MPIEPGLVMEFSKTVEEGDTARASAGDSLPPVLSTPKLIGLLEQAAHTALLPHLAEGQGSVGALVNVRHLAATPVGMQVRIRAEVMEVDGRRVRFKVEAWDAVDKIAEGEHDRFIIDRARFNERLEKKRGAIGRSGDQAPGR